MLGPIHSMIILLKHLIPYANCIILSALVHQWSGNSIAQIARKIRKERINTEFAAALPNFLNLAHCQCCMHANIQVQLIRQAHRP